LNLPVFKVQLDYTGRSIKNIGQETVNCLFTLRPRASGAVHTASNLLNSINWQKATSWLFTKRRGIEFRTTGDKTSCQGSERDLIPSHTLRNLAQ